MTKHSKHRAPGFLLARIVLYFVGAASAAFGVAGWIIPELPAPGWAAIVLAGLTGLSAAVVPVSCEIVGRSFWSILLVPAALVFGGINAYSFHHAVDALIEEPRREAHRLTVIEPLEQKLAQASKAVAAHLPPVFPDTMGPKNIAARMEAWNMAHRPLLDAEVSASDALKGAPAHIPFAPDTLVWGVAVAIDLSLAFGLAGIALTTGSIQRRIDRDRAKVKKPKRKPKVQKAKAPDYSGFPKLVAANDR